MNSNNFQFESKILKKYSIRVDSVEFKEKDLKNFEKDNQDNYEDKLNKRASINDDKFNKIASINNNKLNKSGSKIEDDKYNLKINNSLSLNRFETNEIDSNVNLNQSIKKQNLNSYNSNEGERKQIKELTKVNIELNERIKNLVELNKQEKQSMKEGLEQQINVARKTLQLSTQINDEGWRTQMYSLKIAFKDKLNERNDFISKLKNENELRDFKLNIYEN